MLIDGPIEAIPAADTEVNMAEDSVDAHRRPPLKLACVRVRATS